MHIHSFKMQTSVISFFSIHKVVQLSPLSNFRTFSPLQKETLYLLAVTPHFLFLLLVGSGNH